MSKKQRRGSGAGASTNDSWQCSCIDGHHCLFQTRPSPSIYKAQFLFPVFGKKRPGTQTANSEKLLRCVCPSTGSNKHCSGFTLITAYKNVEEHEREIVCDSLFSSVTKLITLFIPSMGFLIFSVTDLTMWLSFSEKPREELVGRNNTLQSKANEVVDIFVHSENDV